MEKIKGKDLIKIITDEKADEKEIIMYNDDFYYKVYKKDFDTIILIKVDEEEVNKMDNIFMICFNVYDRESFTYDYPDVTIDEE